MDEFGSDNQRLLDVLLQEYGRVCDDIRSIESSNDKILLFSLSAVAGAQIFIAAEKNPQLYLFFPAIATIIIAYAMMIYSWIFRMGGYKRLIEEQINDIVQSPALIWESTIKFRDSISSVSITLKVLYGIGWFYISGYTMYKSFDRSSTWGWASLIECSVCFLGLGYVVIRSTNAHEDFYEHAKKTLLLKGTRYRGTPDKRQSDCTEVTEIVSN